MHIDVSCSFTCVNYTSIATFRRCGTAIYIILFGFSLFFVTPYLFVFEFKKPLLVYFPPSAGDIIQRSPPPKRSVRIFWICTSLFMNIWFYKCVAKTDTAICICADERNRDYIYIMLNKHIIQTLLRTYVVVTIAWSGSRNHPSYTSHPNYLVNNVLLFWFILYRKH